MDTVSSVQMEPAKTDSKTAVSAAAARMRPDFGHLVVPLLKSLLKRRAQGKPGADGARSPVCKRKAHGGRTTGTAEQSRLSPRNGFTVSFVLSPVSGLCCHRYPASTGRQGLTPGSRRQDHTTSPSASRAFRPVDQSPDACSGHRIPRPTLRDDAQRPS
jgi:hypothetical protein